MIKYIGTLATELDGHAGSETFYMQTDIELKPKDFLEICLAEDLEDLKITHEADSEVYGSLFGYDFAFTMIKLPLRIASNKVLSIGTRTG